MLPRSLLSCATIFAAVVFGETQTQTKHQTSQPSSTSSTAIPTVSIAVGAVGGTRQELKMKMQRNANEECDRMDSYSLPMISRMFP